MLWCLTLGRKGAAEVILGETGGWEFYSDGRLSAFVSYANGDAFPSNHEDFNGNQITILPGAGLSVSNASTDSPGDVQGTHESMRVRSGFVGNILGVGVRRQLTETTTLRTYIHIASYIESESRRKYRSVPADVREAYAKLEGSWGSLLAGRSTTLFSRGATNIDFLYGHGYGLGFPGSVDVNGPAAGHIGFGVLANGFAAGVVYATPSLSGLQVAIGAYDPSSLVGSPWVRTRLLRPEAEITYDLAFSETSRLQLFVNGTWQELFKAGGKDSTSAIGAGYGGRLEVGPVHLGIAAHQGRGLGLSYALEPSETTVATFAGQNDELRFTDGFYGQLQVALQKLDINLGAGITRVHLLDSDKIDLRDDDNDGATATNDDDPTPGFPDPIEFSVNKHQLGLSAALVYHYSEQIHFDVDYFRAQFAWHQGEEQNVNFVNTGMTVQW
jgi:hypothetical protein